MKKTKWSIVEDMPEFPNGGATNPPIYVNDPKDPRLQRYNDSLDLFKSYQQLKTNLNKQGYESAHIPSSMIMKEKDIINYAASNYGDSVAFKYKISKKEIV